MDGSCGGSRRRFLKTAAASGAALASADTLLAAAPPKSPIPEVTLGKTGVKVSRLGMGTSWDVAESFVQRAIAAGVRYIDTSETYERGNAEKAVGNVLARTGQRKDVYLVTKNGSYAGLRGSERAKSFVTHLQSSLDRLQTDYVDCYYIHGIAGKQIDMFQRPRGHQDLRAAQEGGQDPVRRLLLPRRHAPRAGRGRRRGRLGRPDDD